MPSYRISFQLYSARNFPPVEAQLQTLAQIGYDAVEPYGGAYEGDAAGFRRKLDAAGLVCPSAHVPLAQLDDDRRAVLDLARTLGLETVVIPAIPPEQRAPDAAGWKSLAARLANHASALAGYGLKLAWHNHAFEFVTLPDGSRPLDHLLAADGVRWEPDIGWIARGGADVRAELIAFKTRIVAFHMKDMAPEGVTADDGWTDVGVGTIDWRGTWPAIAASGANLLVIEHDAPSDWCSFAENSYRFLAGFVGR